MQQYTMTFTVNKLVIITKDHSVFEAVKYASQPTGIFAFGKFTQNGNLMSGEVSEDDMVLFPYDNIAHAIYHVDKKEEKTTHSDEDKPKTNG